MLCREPSPTGSQSPSPPDPPDSPSPSCCSRQTAASRAPLIRKNTVLDIGGGVKSTPEPRGGAAVATASGLKKSEVRMPTPMLKALTAFYRFPVHLTP